MKRIPYGISDYEELIEKGYYYVDKTEYLSKLELISEKIIYLRPRRFGKTLFTSMMYYYYDINSRDKFDKLFKGTKVYEEPTSLRNSYYVLKLDFSGMATDKKNIDDIEKQFIEKITMGISKFIEYYNLNMDIDYNGRANQIILRFLSSFERLFSDKKIYVIIDEYDKFTNAILEGNAQVFKSILGKDGFVRAFYEPLKEYSGIVVDRIFITGVCSISVDAMTSGFNVATDITNDIEFNAMTALTHEEVRVLISDIDKNRQEEIFNTMLEYYDGYKFNAEVNNKVFNPTLVMYYLSNYYRLGEEPRNLFDKNIISNYDQIRNIIKLKNNDTYNDVLKELLTNRVITSKLKSNFDLKSVLLNDDIVSLLYYFGYITMSGYDKDKIIFTIPNKVINDVFDDYFTYLIEEANIKVNMDFLTDAVYEMAEVGKIDILNQLVSNVFEEAGNRLLMNFDEKYVQLMYFTILSYNDTFRCYNEYEVKKGYCDLVLLSDNDVSKYDFIIEFKYISLDYCNDKVIDRKRKEALEQIDKYSLDRRLDKKRLKKYIIIFVGKKIEVLEEVK